MNFNWSSINANSVVLVTASEYDPQGAPDADGSAQRIVGDALIRVDNIAPHGPPSDRNQGVTFVLEVDWDEPLNVCTDITVLDDTPKVTYIEGANSPQH
ncbi:MAG: hypothetical protein WA484_04995 [Solirubrobacteraceae bacterium]